MKILDMLYDGQIYPAESVKPATEKYQRLNEEKQRIDELSDGICDEECRCMFAEGVRFGVGLMKELGEMDKQDK